MFFTKTLHFLQEKATQSRSVQVRSLSPYTTMPPIVFEYSILLRQGLKPFSGVSVGQFEGSELLLSWESGFFFVFTIINGGESAWLLRNAADAPLKSPESEQYCFLEHSFCYWEHYKNENTDAREKFKPDLIWYWNFLSSSLYIWLTSIFSRSMLFTITLEEAMKSASTP